MDKIKWMNGLKYNLIINIKTQFAMSFHSEQMRISYKYKNHLSISTEIPRNLHYEKNLKWGAHAPVLKAKQFKLIHMKKT
jgi:hypothetical protein